MKRTLVVGALTLAVTAALAAQPRFGPGPGPGAGLRMMERLDLTDAQRKQAADLRAAHEKKMIQLHSRIAESRVDLRTERRAEAPDRAGVEKALRALSDARLQAQLERTKFWFDVRALLTPEQQKQWKDLPERGQRMREGWRGGRKHGPRGRCWEP